MKMYVLFISKLILPLFFIEGSLVRPKVVKSVHFCPSSGQFTTREYRDITSTMGLPTGSVYPTRVIFNLSAAMFFDFIHSKRI